MNEMQLYDIYEHWHVPFWQTTLFKMLMGAMVLALILTAILIYYKRYYKPKEIPAGLRALNALSALEKNSIVTKEDAQAVYFKLTDILKNFFQHQYGIPFNGMSDAEMITALRTTPMPHQLMPSLKKMVDASMHVKYAQHDVLQPELLHHISMAKNIIQKII
jgi:hypothetical protein